MWCQPTCQVVANISNSLGLQPSVNYWVVSFVWTSAWVSHGVTDCFTCFSHVVWLLVSCLRNSLSWGSIPVKIWCFGRWTSTKNWSPIWSGGSHRPHHECGTSLESLYGTSERMEKLWKFCSYKFCRLLKAVFIGWGTLVAWGLSEHLDLGIRKLKTGHFRTN